MHTYPIKPIPGDPTDPADLTALLHRYLIWMETHHYAKATALTHSHLPRNCWCAGDRRERCG